MPHPGRFKGEGAKERWMEQCMHQTLHKEQKDSDQAKAICLTRWRKEKGGEKAPPKKKKAVADHVRELAGALKE